MESRFRKGTAGPSAAGTYTPVPRRVGMPQWSATVHGTAVVAGGRKYVNWRGNRKSFILKIGTKKLRKKGAYPRRAAGRMTDRPVRHLRSRTAMKCAFWSANRFESDGVPKRRKRKTIVCSCPSRVLCRSVPYRRGLDLGDDDECEVDGVICS